MIRGTTAWRRMAALFEGRRERTDVPAAAETAATPPLPNLAAPFDKYRNAVVRTLRGLDLASIDLVIGHSLPTLEALAWLKHRHGLRVCLDCVETPVLRERSGDAYRHRDAGEVAALQAHVDARIEAMDALLTVGPSLARFLAARYGRQVEVLRNFHTAAALTTPPLRLARRDDDTGVRIANPTPFVTDYAPAVPLAMLAALPPDFSMLHFGAAPTQGAVAAPAAARAAGVERRIDFCGHLPAWLYRDALRQCDLGLHWLPDTLGNLRMAFPNRLADFVAARLPILTSTTPDVAAFVREHDIGVVAARDDAEALAAGAATLVADLPRYRANLEAVAARFTWEREMETLGPLLGNARTVMILTQKPVDYQARTEKLARHLAARGVKVLYLATHMNDLDTPLVDCMHIA